MAQDVELRGRRPQRLLLERVDACRPTTRNRTRWRDGPTGSSRKSVAVDDSITASGSSQGRSRSAATSSRSRSRGKSGPATARVEAARSRRRQSCLRRYAVTARRSRRTRTGGGRRAGGGRPSSRRRAPVGSPPTRSASASRACADPALAGPGVHDQREDPDEPVVVSNREEHGTRRSRAPRPPCSATTHRAESGRRTGRSARRGRWGRPGSPRR